MSVADILRQIGKPTESSEFTKFVAEELNISERQAYRLIKKTWKNQDIRKHIRQDRTVLYLLPEWSYSELEGKVEAYFRKCKEQRYLQTTLDDCASKLGVPPRDVEELVYRYGHKCGIAIGLEIKKKPWLTVGEWDPIAKKWVKGIEGE